MKEETVILSPRDIMEILKISLQTAYKIINELNIELEEINRKRKSEGKLPYIIFRAKIYRKYFYERYKNNDGWNESGPIRIHLPAFAPLTESPDTEATSVNIRNILHNTIKTDTEDLISLIINLFTT